MANEGKQMEISVDDDIKANNVFPAKLLKAARFNGKIVFWVSNLKKKKNSL